MTNSARAKAEALFTSITAPQSEAFTETKSTPSAPEARKSGIHTLHLPKAMRSTPDKRTKDRSNRVMVPPFSDRIWGTAL